MIDFNGLVAGFKNAGLDEGDTVLVHSSYKSFGGVDGGPQTVVDALLSVLGKKGTLIVPRFNFDFSTHGTPWDVRTTPSQMGIITEFVRKDPRSKKIFHPIYSFSIIGKHADELASLRYKGSFSKESVFHKLRMLDGKIMQIDKVYKGTTFVHYVEEMVGCDYKFFKNFTGKVTDEKGRTFIDTFNIYVRDWNRGVVTDVIPMGKILEREGVMKISKVGDATVWLMKSEDVYQCTVNAMKKNPHILCKIIPPTEENSWLIKNYSETLKQRQTITNHEQ